MIHLRNLEDTHEARVALSCASSNTTLGLLSCSKLPHTSQLDACLKCQIFGSCVLKATAVECRLIPSIDTLDRWLINIPIDTRWTLKQHLINSRLLTSQLPLMHLSNNFLLTVDQDVHGMPIKCQPRCQWCVDRWWITGINPGY